MAHEPFALLRRRLDGALVRHGSRLTISATYARRGDAFAVRVPAYYLTTEAPLSSCVEPVLREVMALWLDVAADAFDVELRS